MPTQNQRSLLSSDSIARVSADVSGATRGFLWLVMVACLLLVASQLLDFKIGTVVSKLAASCGFIAVALSRGAMASSYGRVVLVALVCSWIGDAFLLRDSQIAFQSGLISFLLAHLGYLAAFGILGLAWRHAGIALIATGLISLLAMLWLTPYIGVQMRIPVWAYTVVITLMVAAAFGTRGGGASALIPWGALLFYCSDLSVAAGQFVQPDFPNYVWGLPFYYAGQTLLALSVAPGLVQRAQKQSS